MVVDTPGVGSVNGEHTAATRAFLERADGLVFVCDAIEPPATYELDFLGEALEKCEVVVTAVTKTDRVRDAGPVVAATREKLAVRTGSRFAPVWPTRRPFPTRRRNSPLRDVRSRQGSELCLTPV